MPPLQKADGNPQDAPRIKNCLKTALLPSEVRGTPWVNFESQETEVVVGFPHPWTAERESHEPTHALLGLCAGHLIGLHSLVQFSLRLQRLIVCSVEFIGYEAFNGVEVEGFTGLLNHLHVTVEDIGRERIWVRLLLDTIWEPNRETL